MTVFSQIKQVKGQEKATYKLFIQFRTFFVYLSHQKLCSQLSILIVIFDNVEDVIAK